MCGRGEEIFPDIRLGLVGAMAGGWLYCTFGPTGVSGLNLFSLFAAVIGSLVFLPTYYAFRRS
jgi:uncharacterized membrane protein YeaQ/YmgE (transglycosylase-associated protein family)